jgi:hypothetical protein
MRDALGVELYVGSSVMFWVRDMCFQGRVSSMGKVLLYIDYDDHGGRAHVARRKPHQVWHQTSIGDDGVQVEA